MISAPSETIRSACTSACCGSKNRPPSEKESGVTFKIPITNARFTVSSWRNGNGSRRAIGYKEPAAIMAERFARSAPGCQDEVQCGGLSLICDLEGQFLRLLDPAAHGLLRW